MALPTSALNPLVVAPRAERKRGTLLIAKKRSCPTPSWPQVKAGRSHRISSAEPKDPGTCFKSPCLRTSIKGKNLKKKALICYKETLRFREGKTLAPGHMASLDAFSEASDKSRGPGIVSHLLGPGRLCYRDEERRRNNPEFLSPPNYSLDKGPNGQHPRC